jgi:hypothetical protein
VTPYKTHVPFSSRATYYSNTLVQHAHIAIMSSSIPAAATDSKTAHLLQEEEPAPVEAPPSYVDSSKPAPPVIGDGNVFSDLPRPGMTRPGMTYGPGQAQAYIPRDRKGTWSFGLFSCFSDPAAGMLSSLTSSNLANTPQPLKLVSVPAFPTDRLVTVCTTRTARLPSSLLHVSDTVLPAASSPVPKASSVS